MPRVGPSPEGETARRGMAACLGGRIGPAEGLDGKVGNMEPYGGPAALGGMIGGLMLGAWMLGRWQGVAGGGALHTAGALPDRGIGTDGEAASDRLCQQAAHDERRAAFADEFALAELHADITAYRAAQQVLSDAEVCSMPIGWSASGEGETCRYIGVSGQPTCPVVLRVDADCGCGSCPADLRRELRVQPSAVPAVLTRV